MPTKLFQDSLKSCCSVFGRSVTLQIWMMWCTALLSVQFLVSFTLWFRRQVDVRSSDHTFSLCHHHSRKFAGMVKFEYFSILGLDHKSRPETSVFVLREAAGCPS